ncbi:MAG TPA: hypothetical protein VHK89_04780 [Actinomycetota bacterium]|nr:hypothetical protein [Actinomycetota bacterium]
MARGGWGRGARGGAAAVALALLAAPLVGGTAFGAGRWLDLKPDVDDVAVGDYRTIRATLSSPPDVAPVEVDFEIVGVGDTDGGNTPGSPDRSCTVAVGALDDPASTNVDESRTCSIKYKGTVEGRDEVRGWIDEDGSNASVEADMAEQPAAGEGAAGQDGTDVVVTEWFPATPKDARLDCAESPVVVVGDDSAGVVCRIGGAATLAGWRIDGENLGGANATSSPGAFPADVDDACVTGADGRCTARLGSSRDAGSADICFWVDWDRDMGFHPQSDADGADCDEGVGDTSANANITDVVRADYVHGRTLRWSAVEPPVYGSRFKLRGVLSSSRAACAAGAQVTVRRQPLGGDATTVATARTGSGGGFSVRLEARRSARYTASVARDGDCASAASAAKLVMVRTRVGLSIGRSAVERGDRVRVRASFRPCGPRGGLEVRLLRSTDGGRSFSRVATRSSDGDCTATFRPRIFGRTLLRAEVRGDSQFLGGASANRLVRLG